MNYTQLQGNAPHTLTLCIYRCLTFQSATVLQFADIMLLILSTIFVIQ